MYMYTLRTVCTYVSVEYVHFMRHGSPKRIKRDLDALIELHGSIGRESLLYLMCD